MSPKTQRSKTRVKGFQSPEMDFQLIRQLGAGAYGGSSVGQCMSIAARISDGQPDSWVQEFKALAQAEQAAAEKRLAAGRKISARDQFLNASNLFRAAEYYADPRTPQRNPLGYSSRDCFIKAMENSDHNFERCAIPFENGHLPGYFLSPAVSGAAGTVIIMSGFDGTCEESYFQGGRAGLERGYNVLLFAGPGQVDALRDSPELVFRPDFEAPVGAALDWLLARPEVDPQRVALYGISFGGFFATRAAAHDSRIKALIANSPIVDLYAYMCGFFPFDPAEMPDNMDFGPDDHLEDDPEIPKDMAENIRASTNMCIRFGRPTLKNTFIRMKEFKVGEALPNIKCPCLGMVGEGEGEEPQGQAQAFCQGVSGPVTIRVFTAAEGADTHCQVGNLALSCAEVFDWLDAQFA